MASTQQLKLRIRSVKSTKQITKAMQMVAASKMRRTQDATKASAPYTRSANELLAYLASQGATDDHPLFAVREVKRRLIVVVASDKGLAGAYNTNVIKKYLQLLKEDDDAGIANSTIAVGRKTAQVASRLKDTDITGTYTDMSDNPHGPQFFALQSSVRELFEEGEVDAVDVIYTDFISSIKQEVVVKRILPAGYEATTISERVSDAKYEPDVRTILDTVAARLVGAQIFQALLDARASEHSMRMMAMKNATDNASELASDLTLAMNKARQAAITQELSEISAGAEAIG